jgi:hypothetical protein
LSAPYAFAGQSGTPFPLPAANLAPLTQLTALPRDTALAFRPADEMSARLGVDVANHFAGDRAGQARLLFDGETYRTTLSLQGRHRRLSWRLALPWVAHNGGMLDGAIDAWHETFDMPEGGRPAAPRDRILFRILDAEGGEVLRLDRAVSGPGDVAGSLGYALTGESAPVGLGVGMRLEAPTGSRRDLLGSGGWDGALWLSARRAGALPLGRYALSVSGGGVFSGESPVPGLSHRHRVGYGRLFAGWAPGDRLRVGAQLDMHGAFYNSPLGPLGRTASELRIHGGVRLAPRTWLRAGFSEDVAVGTAPDVTFHFTLSRRVDR